MRAASSAAAEVAEAACSAVAAAETALVVAAEFGPVAVVEAGVALVACGPPAVGPTAAEVPVAAGCSCTQMHSAWWTTPRVCHPNEAF